MPQVQRNNQTIANAFQRFTARKDRIVEEGFTRLMEFGLKAMLDIHDTSEYVHHHNFDEKETIGWMIFHDGVEVASGSQDRGTLSGAVLFRLEELGSQTHGWVGYLMSEMAFEWYRVDWETDFLRTTADEVRSRFHSFFQPI